MVLDFKDVATWRFTVTGNSSTVSVNDLGAAEGSKLHRGAESVSKL